ncbi:MAG: four helix bundle protein [Patescibacteria group bacterium]|nr:four helix bundle protein [Patescibacteria group bacterium]
MANTTNNSIESRENKYDIHKRIYDFIIRAIKLVNQLPRNQANQVITGQVLRSVTSIGANDQEADGTLTKKDFIHCYTMVRKEGKETIFWLSLISDTNPSFKPRMSQIIQEGKEIVAIVSAIINKSRS